MSETYTVYLKRGESIDEGEDRFFAENPELLTRHDLTLFIVDLYNDLVEEETYH